jgi:RimK family alpha-L-glutamate ligase
MIYQEAVIMAINGVIVTNIGQKASKYKAQTDDFLQKSTLIANLSLKEVSNPHVLSYVATHKVDFILFWDKDIFLARTLESLGYKVFNNPETIYLCDDKALTAYALTKEGVTQPNYFVFPLHFYGNIFDYYDLYKDELLKLGFPLVIKERFGSFGEQVYLAKDEDSLKDIIKEHGTKPLLGQAFISEGSGSDYRLNVVGEEVLLSVKRTNTDDFRSNINQGGNAKEVEVAPLMKQTAILATKAVHGHFAGVDIMLKDGIPHVLEVNSNMRTIAVNKVSNVDLTLKILEYIINNI